MNPSLSPAAAELVALWPDELRRQAANQIKWLWQGYLAPGNVTLLTSQWKAGKTTLLAMLLDRLRAGGSLAGLPVRPGKAVVVSEESPAHWALRDQRFQFTDQVCFLCRPFNGKPRPEQWQTLLDRLQALHRQFRLDLAVIDTLAAFLPAGSENQADAMLNALLPLQRLTNEGLAVLAMHHPRKREAPGGMAARGSGALTGFADILLEMHWYAEAAEDDRRRRLLAWSRYDETPRQLVLELNAAGTDYSVLEEADADAANAAAEKVKEEPHWLGSPLWLVLENASTKLTRQGILGLWPPDHPRPGPVPLWRMLGAAVERGDLKRDGAGTRADPFFYWLPALEERWRQDPLAGLAQLTLDSSREVQRLVAPLPGMEVEE
jgi:hypothetical protein